MEKINRRVYLKVANKCNKQCSFCYYQNDPKPYGEMTRDMVMDIIEKELEIHEDNKYLRVILTGGEPILCSNLESILHALSKISIVRIVLETNGTMVDKPEFLNILNYFKLKHFLKIAIYSELLDADEEYKNKLIEFIQFAKETGIRYILNPRYVDEADKAKLKAFVTENNLAPEFGEVLYYPIYNCNLYRDGSLPGYDFPYITYEYDGTVLTWYQPTSE